MEHEDKIIEIVINKRNYSPKVIDIWALGITVVIGGQYFGWNYGFSAGLGSFAIATGLIGSAYVCLAFSLAEITSALPFAGGCYALTRCMIGFYPGFIVGCCEALEYITYVATSAISLSQIIISLLDLDPSMQPVICLLFYISALSIYFKGGKVFWTLNFIMAIMSVMIILVYCFGNVNKVDISKYAQYNDDSSTVSINNHWFHGGIVSFLKALPLPAWFYCGVESLGFASDDVDEPKKIIPRGFISCVLTLLTTSILMIFICASLSPGISITSSANAPLSPGFMNIFGVSSNVALLFSIPAIYATAFGYMFGYGKILQSMASSKLFPVMLSLTTTVNKTPYVAITVGSLIGFIICILTYYFPVINTYLFNICILNGFISYVAQCISYIKLKYKHEKLEREYHSPFGIYGSIFAIVIYVLGIVSIIGFQEDNGTACLTVVGVIGILSCYYFGYAQKVQIFSNEEIRLTFNQMVVKFNNRILNRMKRNYTVTSGYKKSSFGDAFPIMISCRKNILDLVSRSSYSTSISYPLYMIANQMQSMSTLKKRKVHPSSELYGKNSFSAPVAVTCEPNDTNHRKDFQDIQDNQDCHEFIEHHDESPECQLSSDHQGNETTV